MDGRQLRALEADDGMASLMVSNRLALVLFKRHRFPFFAPTHLVPRFFEFNQRDLFFSSLSAQDRSFVQKIREFSAGHTRSRLRDDIESVIDRMNRILAAMSRQNRAPALLIRQ